MKVHGRVFVSSTLSDLEEYRKAADEAILEAGFFPVLSDRFAAGGPPPLDKCLEKTSGCDLAVAIVAHRYGWIPPVGKDTEEQEQERSITWRECQVFLDEGKQVLAFLVDPKKHDWPGPFRDSYRLDIGEEDVAAIQRDVARLREFKTWLDEKCYWKHFDSPADLKSKVLHALLEWRDKYATTEAPARGHKARKPKQTEDPTNYLRGLIDRCARIDIRGLQVGTGKAFSFPIDELYMTLTAAQFVEEPKDEVEAVASVADKVNVKSRGKAAGKARIETLGKAGKHVGEMLRRESLGLHLALENARLVVIGDPGSGKTTFLRRVAFELCRAQLGGERAGLRLSSDLFPILFRIGDLASYIERHADDADAPDKRDAAAWLPRFLAADSRAHETPLSEDFFRNKLKSDACLVMADGLDEAPDRQKRVTIRKVIEHAAAAFGNCRIVVSSRPSAYVEKAVLDGWEHAAIDHLSPDAVEKFLSEWCGKLHENAKAAEEQLSELQEALRSRREIRRMARNPVMLTALAVVLWNERRLPEQRADLYESILIWLARAREDKRAQEDKERRESAARCLELLQELALKMQTHEDGRQTQVPAHWAAEQLAPEFGAGNEAFRKARDFLSREEVDSGIIVGAGNQVRFWHLTFQEYLAAKAVASRTDADQTSLLFADSGRFYSPEWREMLLLLAGVLHDQGKAKADRFVEEAIGKARRGGSLKMQVKCLGLLGAALRDLKPLDYSPPPKYANLQKRVQAIFDPKQSYRISVKDRAAAADALDEQGPKQRDEPWVKIKAGKFLMGAQHIDSAGCNYDSEASSWEAPVHEVELSSFWIARYPVTVREFEEFVANSGYETRKYWGSGGFGCFELPEGWDQGLEYPNRPVAGISWWEAQAFCRFKGTRLPTEEEWEYAARDSRSRRFPWTGEDVDENRANFGRKLGHPSPVGIYPKGATEEGIFDMVGNVWEWCENAWRRTYDVEPDRALRVVRGGSWLNSSWALRCSARLRLHPGRRDNNVGFRMVVLTPPYAEATPGSQG